MAQIRTWDFGADDDTLTLNEALLQQMEAGVYGGYTVTRGSAAGLTLSFRHEPRPGLAALVARVDGATSVPATRQLTSVTAGLNALVTLGDLLRIEDPARPGDDGDYIVIARNDTTITVDRNWPAGSLTNLRFRVYSAMGTVRTPSGVVVRETACQDGVLSISAGGAQVRLDRVVCRYVYNASTPANTASYVVLTGAGATAAVADGDLTGGQREFTSVTGGFLSLAEGHILRIADAVDDSSNGDYTILRIESDTKLHVDRNWPDGSLTGLTFQVLRPQALTANDVLLAEVEVPAGAPNLDTATITQAAEQTSSEASTGLSLVLTPGVYRGGTLVQGSLGTMITVEAGLVVTPYASVLDIEVDQTDVLSVVLAAAGFHRMSAVVLKRIEGPGLDPDAWTVHEVAGTAVATNAAPRLPNMATILAGVGAPDPRDVTILGSAYVNETEVRVYSVGKREPPRAITVHDGHPAHSGTQGELFGPDGIREALDAYWALLQGDTFPVLPEPTRESQRPFEILCRGTFDLFGPLVCPSRVVIRGDQGRAVLRSDAAVAVKFAGREFVGNDVDPTWAAVAQANPADTPTGYALFRLTIDAAYQVGDNFEDLLIGRWDPVQLREGTDGLSSWAGWVHQVVSPWVIDVFLPSAFDTNADEGDLRVAKWLCGLRDIVVTQQDASPAVVLYHHVDDGVLTRIRVPTLDFASLRGCDVSAVVESALAQTETSAALHSEVARPNNYEFVVLNGSCTIGGSSPQGSSYTRVDLRSSAAQAWILGEAGATYSLVRLDGRALGGTLTISGAGAMAVDVRRQPTDQTVVTAVDTSLTDRASYVNADRNFKLTTTAGTAFTWDGSTLTYPQVTVNYAGETFTNVLPAGSQALADGQAAYVTLSRKAAAAALGLNVAALTAVPQSDLTLVVAYRKGTTLFFWDASRLEAGEAGSPGVITVGDGSVTFDKLDPSAIKVAVAGLGDYTDKPRDNLSDPNALVFGNSGAVVPGYDNATGWATYASAVDLSAVLVGDVLINTGYRWRIYEVDNDNDRVRLQAGLSGIWGAMSGAAPFNYIIVRGNVHWQNTGLDPYSYSLVRASGVDGDTSTGASTFVSAGAAFLTTAREGGILVLRDTNAAQDDDNGYYRIAGVTNNTTLTIEGVWPDGTMTGVTYEVQAGEITVVDQGGVLVPPANRESHFRTTDGRVYPIRDMPSNTQIIIDPYLSINTDAPSLPEHGSVELANNPRGLLFDDCSVRFGVEAVRLNGDLQDMLDEPPRVSWYNGLRMPAQGFLHEPRVRFYGGGWKFTERGAQLNQDEFAGQEVQITYFGTYAAPRFTTGVGNLSQITDGYLVQGSGVTGDFVDGMDMVYEPHATAWVVNPQDQVLDIIPALGIHTLTLRLPAAFDAAVAGVTGTEFILEGFDIIVHPSNDEVVELAGTAFVAGRPATKTSRSTVALPTPTGSRGARVVRYVAPDGTRAWAISEGRRIADIKADAVATDTLSNLSSDPALTGLRPGDLVTLIGAGSEEVRIVESTPTADTIVLTAATTLSETDVTVRFRGRTGDEGTSYYSDAADIHEFEDVVTVLPIVAAGRGSEVISGGPVDGAAVATAGGAITYTLEDGATTVVISTGAYDLTTNDRRGVTVGAGGNVWFTFVGTGADLWLAFKPDTDAAWSVTIDGVAGVELLNYNSRGTTFGLGGAVLIPLVADLPFGTHVIQLAPLSGGISIEGLVIYAQAQPEYAGFGLAEGFIPADAAEQRIASLLDPGDGWIRCHAGYRTYYRDGAGGAWAATADTTVRGAIQWASNAVNDYAYHRLWSEDVIWWGVLGAGGPDVLEVDGVSKVSGERTSLSLGLHLIDLDSNFADNMEWHAVDYRVPVYAYHVNRSRRNGDWLGYGGGLRDMRRVHPELRLPLLAGRRRIGAMHTTIPVGVYGLLKGCSVCTYVDKRGLYEITGYSEAASTDAAAVITARIIHNGAWLGLHRRQRVHGATDPVTLHVTELTYLERGWHWFALLALCSAGALSSEQRGLQVKRIGDEP